MIPHKIILTYSFIETPLGSMIAIANEKFLYYLKFIDDQDAQQELNRVQKTTHSIIKLGSNNLLEKLSLELKLYFNGSLQVFTTPVSSTGTNFQQKSWAALQTIPYGKTINYATQAQLIKHPQAHRAIANANGRNPILILIPCHRVINSSGKLGGYSNGLHRKKSLLDLEQK